MDVSIIIVNYNTIELTKQCIFSIDSHITGIDFQVIVVDNNSDDNSVKIITDNFPDVIFITTLIPLLVYYLLEKSTRKILIGLFNFK